MRWGIIVGLCAFAWVAQAAPTEDADTEAARRHSNSGLRAYDAGDYRRALTEFETARALKPLPGIDYNIGRCFERLEDWGEAAAAFQRFVDARPDSPDVPELRERIKTLRSRVPKQKPVPPLMTKPMATPPVVTPPVETPPVVTSPSARPSVVAPAVLGATAVLLAAAGTGGYLSAWGDYQSSVSQCQRMCDPAQLGSLPDQVRTAEITGGVLWGLAAAAATVDVILWVRWARQPRQLRSASLVHK